MSDNDAQPLLVDAETLQGLEPIASLSVPRLLGFERLPVASAMPRQTRPVRPCSRTAAEHPAASGHKDGAAIACRQPAAARQGGRDYISRKIDLRFQSYRAA